MLKIIPHAGLPDSYDKALRSEDIRFSPSGKLLAVVATSGNIFLFAVDTKSRPIRITHHVTLQSPGLAAPHGIDFLNEDIVVVANRGGWLTCFKLPPVSSWNGAMTIQPIHETTSEWFGAKGSTRPCKGRMVNCGPGSVRVSGDRMFVCCNYKGTVSSLRYRVRRDRIETDLDTLVASDLLDIPDGLSLSRDGQWLAVGEHESKTIYIHRRSDYQVACQLHDANLSHPHGICFDPDGRALYVADAGERGIHVFVTADAWATSMDASTFSMPAVDVEAFRRTKESVAEQYRPLEGGLKGLDVSASGRLIATTCQNQMLRFFESDLAPAETQDQAWSARMKHWLLRISGRR